MEQTPLTYDAMVTRLNDGYYRSKVEIVRDGDTPAHRMSAEAKAAHRASWQEHSADTKRLEAEFRADALAASGLAAHPRAAQLYDFVWQEAHSSGLHDVWYMLCELAAALNGPDG